MGTVVEAHFLSTHSSNPLQVPSDDVLNQEFVEHIRPLLEIEKARAAQGLSPRTSTPSLLQGQIDHDGNDPEEAEEELDITIQPLEYKKPRSDAGSVNILDQWPSQPRATATGNDYEDDGVEIHISQLESVNAAEEMDQLDDEDEDEEDGIGDDTTVTMEHQVLLERYHDENTILLRDPDDQAHVRAEIDDLERAVPRILREYLVMDRLGEGTFSSVYKALDLNHIRSDERSRRHRHPNQAPSNPIVAIKRIYVTSSPARIANELSILVDCEKCRNVSKLLTAFRWRDQVVAVMPYVANQDFREMFPTMSIPSTQGYFRCLFRALADIHALGIVHRDVKPANFLFNPFENTGTLCDFGLAQRLESEAASNTCLHTIGTIEELHGRHRLLKEYHRTRVAERMKEARKRATLPSERVGVPAEESRPSLKANRAGTRGFRAPEVLLKCQDQSVALDIWSAGTILLSILAVKFPMFTASDDVEALMELAAVFGRNTMEKCAKLHGRTFSTNIPSVDHDEMSWGDFAVRINPYLYQKAPVPATYSSSSSSTARRVIKSLPGRSSKVVPSSSHLHHPNVPPSSLPPSSEPIHSQLSSSQTGLATESNIGTPRTPKKLDTRHNELIDLGLDLLGKCLHWDCTRRITARDALLHPFLAEADDGILT